MPIVSISLLTPDDSEVIPKIISEIRLSGSKALDCSQDNIWVIFHTVKPGHYIQADIDKEIAAEAAHPPIVVIKAKTGRSFEQKSALVSGISLALSKGLGIPANSIWIHYQEMNPDDIWHEGKWSGS